ncbi:MAG: phenylacetate--CoA ligase family protein [Acidobacteria bacterium]|nr:phenylacetate--CoA ligase family protein [Acidobacteriota bacterium]
MAEAIEREHWSAPQWNAWRQERLSRVLHRAATRVPYYREQWAARRRNGDRASWEYLENWPILEKETLRTNTAAFLADDCRAVWMFYEHTSGTTGKPLDLWWSRTTVREWYALFEARWRRWYGVSWHDHWGILGGQLVTPVSQRRPPFWVWNRALHQLYLSSFHLAPNLIPYYLDALRTYRVKYLLGYTSSLVALADEILCKGRTDLKMTVVVTNAEPVLDYQRRAIAEAFRCPVRETYGMAEIVAAASECQHGGLHLWPEVGLVELMEDNSPAPDHGDLVATGLLNQDMPLIRYRVGDRASRNSIESLCPCGRTLPRIAAIEGRADDVLYTADGRKIGRLDPVFKAQLPIRQAQIIQTRLDCVRVRYVPASDFTPTAARSIAERIRSRMGEVEVILEPVDQIPREPNGKFRAVICSLSAQERQIAQSVTHE